MEEAIDANPDALQDEGIHPPGSTIGSMFTMLGPCLRRLGIDVQAMSEGCHLKSLAWIIMRRGRDQTKLIVRWRLVRTLTTNTCPQVLYGISADDDGGDGMRPGVKLVPAQYGQDM